MSNIFFSYTRQNENIIGPLVRDISSLGHRVWFDQELTGGQDWWDRVLSELRDCDCFAFGLSPESLESYACKLEYTYAADLGKPIIPILLTEGVSVNFLPEALSKIQFVDYKLQDNQAAFALVKALQNLPPPQPLPDPLPEPPLVPVSYLSTLKDQIDTRETLSFEQQSALVLDLKARLRNYEEADDVRRLLGLLRKRDDLLARVAGEIDAVLTAPAVESSRPTTIAAEKTPPPAHLDKPKKPPARPKEVRPKEQWRAKKVSEGWAERVFQVDLGESTHTIEYVHKEPSLTYHSTVSLDGNKVDEGGIMSVKKSFEFQISDGSNKYSGLVLVDLGMLKQLTKLRLLVDGRMLYTEGDW